MKIMNKITLVAAVVGMAAAIQTSQAAISGTDYGATATLAQLDNGGGYLSAGDKTFYGFDYTQFGLQGFDANAINVNVSIDGQGVYYLTWNGLMQTTSAADLTLFYTVTASAGQINMIDQSYTGSGLLAIDETVSANGYYGQPLASSHLDGQKNGDFVGDNLYVDPAQTTLYVIKDIAMSTSESVPLTTISIVSQSFHQTVVPEPSTVVAGALLLLPFGVSTLCILRKNKVQ